MNAIHKLSLVDVLHAHEPAPDHKGQLELYAFLIGAWTAEVIVHAAEKHRGTAEIHAGWVLEGRAVQDVWMIPRRALRTPGAPELPLAGNWYGTTLRVFDPKLEAWHIFWIDPATQRYVRQLGRARGADIVQEGTNADGSISRWRFTHIAANSFHWLGERSVDNGANFDLQVEVLAERARSGGLG